MQGAGLQLHSAQMDRNTENQSKYFNALCLQAGYSGPCAPAPNVSASHTWRLLVETGYNDIDFRCNTYLTWIDSKRSERLLVEGTSNAISILAAGLLKGTSASADKLADIALALGFARDLYDSYQSSILLGLEGSTIKEIVNKRRMAHRESFRNVTYDSRPDAVFALQRYLSICTPQSILTDVNSFSRAAAGGETPPLAAEAAASAQMLGLQPNNPVTPPRRNVAAVPEQSKLFEGQGFSERDVAVFQLASCIDVDVEVGPATLSSVRLLEQFEPVMDSSGRISRTEWDVLRGKMEARPCDTSVYKNVYENYAHGSDGGVAAINALVAAGALDIGFRNQPFNGPGVRDALAELRQRIGPSETFPGLGSMSGQLTSTLYQRAIRN
ncbi:MAG: hypothetical protein AAGM84_04915 [Pseudomonadota bacterium]